MGLGHVPTGSFPRAREGADVPRRKRRGAGATRAFALSRRPALACWGEALAGRFLEDHGLRMVARNVPVGRGEIDLLAWDEDTRVAVEVRTVTGDMDPIDAIDQVKRARVRGLANRIGAQAVALVGVRIHRGGVDVHWVQH